MTKLILPADIVPVIVLSDVATPTAHCHTTNQLYSGTVAAFRRVGVYQW